MGPPVTITCPTCGATAEKRAGHVNRARRLGLAIYCGRACAGLARRCNKTVAERRAEKRVYDMAYRERMGAALKAKRAAYYQNVTAKNPERQRAIRKARMPKHVEYCRRPEYRAKKHEYDLRRNAAAYGEFAEAFRLLKELEREIRVRVPSKYERLKARGYYDRAAQQRRRDARIARW